MCVWPGAKGSSGAVCGAKINLLDSTEADAPIDRKRGIEANGVKWYETTDFRNDGSVLLIMHAEICFVRICNSCQRPELTG